MRKTILIAAATLFTLGMAAKDIKTMTVTTTPQMHCPNCENKIKNNIRFVKGVKLIETSIPNQTVSIKYDADKTSVEKINKAFDKIGYKTKAVKPGTVVPRNENEVCLTCKPNNTNE